MQTTIRMFALFVALAGLAAAALVPAVTHAQPKHASILTGPSAAVPAPLPCQATSCE